ncbi:malto-oligosyltrehalose synthase [Neoactinobaculum massilliense]|uniref:malto-oligosyltrehalose synthase n=1 Tax=Neoactinobaculum massilliense TaxID=2364794 RepID=UPI000F51D20E|nr:malto-oligosyltrehalose synthase [Neoactinobaculum massilliense]
MKVSRRTPISTYRLQLGPQFTFDAARRTLPYLHELGVTDVYCSPILQAAPGSTHGYDVVDHTRISEAMGGRVAFEQFADAAHELGMGVVVDVVPNHMAVPTPLYHNRVLWRVLRDGKDSPYAKWFDVDVSEGQDGLLLPVLGDRIGTVLAKGQLTLERMVVPGFEGEGEAWVLRYFDHVFPVRANTEALPLSELVDRQYYRLAYWRVAEEELNYRRFFDVDTLAAIRVEDPEVFEASHRLLFTEFDAGYIDGFRIDHPDGLANPREYFERLNRATGGAWVVAEKILEDEETLPADWKVAGTTGYELSWRIGAMLADPTGVNGLYGLWALATGETEPYLAMEVNAKRQIIDSSLHAELLRMANLMGQVTRSDVRLRDHTVRALTDAVAALAISMDRYRAYVEPGRRPTAEAEDTITRAARRAGTLLGPDRRETLELVVDILLGREIGSAGRTHDAQRNKAIVQFQQLCGPVMAKGVEDTLFYRFTPYTYANEVGSTPTAPAIEPDQAWHYVAKLAAGWPSSMSTLTTHDTKRGEDVRAAIATLTEYPGEWRDLVTQVRARHAEQAAGVDSRMEALMWQAIYGTWTDEGPIEVDRLVTYLQKAAREEKDWTSWTDPDTGGEERLYTYARTVLASDESRSDIAAFWARTASARQARLLAQKVIALTILGVADNYQGEEITRNILVDPDNRRPVDFAALKARLDALTTRNTPGQSIDDRKLWVTSRILQLRRRIPEAFVGDGSGVMPLATTTGHAIAFARTVNDVPRVLVITERLHRGIHQAGTNEAAVVLPHGRWRDIFTDSIHEGTVSISRLFADLPVAVLYAEEEADA